MLKVRKYGGNWGCYYFLSEKKILKRFVKCHVFAQPPPGQHFAPLPIFISVSLAVLFGQSNYRPGQDLSVPGG
jgi:hypothetical protein